MAINSSISRDVPTRYPSLCRDVVSVGVHGRDGRSAQRVNLCHRFETVQTHTETTEIKRFPDGGEGANTEVWNQSAGSEHEQISGEAVHVDR